MRIGTLTSVALAVMACAATAVGSIAPPPPPHVQYAEADVVVTGKVTSVRKSSIRVAIGDVLKGSVTETIDVGPVVSAGCAPGTAQPPYFKVGDEVLVAARSTEHGYRFVDHTLWSTKLGEDSRASVALAREMLRLADVTEHARRAAMVEHMASDDPVLVDAAMWFQFTELSTPEQSGPHVAGLVAALDAPTDRGRRSALRALIGLTPSEGVERLVDLTNADEREDIDLACAVLARYDRGDTLSAVFEAIDRNPGAWLLQFLGANRRPEALTRMRAALLNGDGDQPAAAVRAYELRIQTFGAVESDIDDLLERVRSGVQRTDTSSLSRALSATRSLRAAAELVDVVRDSSIMPSQLDAACSVLWTMSSQLEIDKVRELLIENAGPFISRLDADGQRMYLCWVLGVIHTPEARAALERAEATDPDDWHGDAWRTLHTWNER